MVMAKVDPARGDALHLGTKKSWRRLWGWMKG